MGYVDMRGYIVHFSPHAFGARFLFLARNFCQPVRTGSEDAFYDVANFSQGIFSATIDPLVSVYLYDILVHYSTLL
jgi:hypothetical protein